MKHDSKMAALVSGGSGDVPPSFLYRCSLWSDPCWWITPGWRSFISHAVSYLITHTTQYLVLVFLGFQTMRHHVVADFCLADILYGP